MQRIQGLKDHIDGKTLPWKYVNVRVYEIEGYGNLALLEKRLNGKIYNNFRTHLSHDPASSFTCSSQSSE